ncbi:CotS family spore coat protein [Caloramator sp. CAR-1]|uniref:CotS family spore coat protein n=1 Tax=Caloramator sp. CAR-1 TaxID=3062777 RepID=UPI0026E22A2A|nr:CotS family spore coat protein [Caloramator sp. CAR-1]MDO6355772.1 CotS family spore coat protein [Caloramator sp. CAR-1]
MPKDKKFLADFFLDDRMFDEFDLKVNEAHPVRSVFVLTTNQGIKILKKVKYPLEDLEFIYNSLNKIRENYPYVINFRLTKEGKPYLIYNDEVYVVLDCVEGREALYQNPLDLKNVAMALAKFHEASRDIGYYDKKSLVGKMVERLLNRIKDLEKFKEIANMHYYKTEFDKIFLENVDINIEKSKEAVDYLKGTQDRHIKDYVFCHHDLAHHNVLMGNDDNVYFLDFDLCILDTRVHDLANFINKALKDNAFTIETINIILDNYNKISKLTKEEINILYAYLLFPKDFYDISRDYYLRTKQWDEDEYVEKLIRKAAYKDDKERVLKGFKKIWL